MLFYAANLRTFCETPKFWAEKVLMSLWGAKRKSRQSFWGSLDGYRL